MQRADYSVLIGMQPCERSPLYRLFHPGYGAFVARCDRPYRERLRWPVRIQTSYAAWWRRSPTIFIPLLGRPREERTPAAFFAGGFLLLRLADVMRRDRASS